MPRKLREIRADLRRVGFVLDHVVGSHQTWRHPTGQRVVLAGHDGADAQRYQERQAREAIARTVAGKQAASEE